MYFPSFAGIRKKILFVAFLAFCFVIGAIHNLFAADVTCAQSFQICQKSCLERGSLLQFSCLGDNFTIENKPRIICNCGDQLESLLYQQRLSNSYSKLLIEKKEKAEK